MNIQLIFLAILYAFTETAYFGWNWSPQSDAEVIADGIVFLLFATACIR